MSTIWLVSDFQLNNIFFIEIGSHHWTCPDFDYLNCQIRRTKESQRCKEGRVTSGEGKMKLAHLPVPCC